MDHADVAGCSATRVSPRIFARSAVGGTPQITPRAGSPAHQPITSRCEYGGGGGACTAPASYRYVSESGIEIDLCTAHAARAERMLAAQAERHGSIAPLSPQAAPTGAGRVATESPPRAVAA
jgi:hypothetical protein